MKINNGVGNFAITKKVTESKLENTNSGSLSRTNEGNSKISEPSLSIVGGNSGNGGGQFRKLDKIVQSEPEIRKDLVIVRYLQLSRMTFRTSLSENLFLFQLLKAFLTSDFLVSTFITNSTLGFKNMREPLSHLQHYYTN